MDTVAHPSTAEQSRSLTARAANALRTETGLARIGLGVVALHMVDDAFLQPNPGTSAGDHLSSGLIPTGLLLLAAWAYPRLRAGFRATLALLFGFLGVLASSEALYYAREVGLSGDDYTGLLSLVGGLVLLGVGAGDPLEVEAHRRPSLVALRTAVLLTSAACVVAVVSCFRSRSAMSSPTRRAQRSARRISAAAHEDVSFETSDGLTRRAGSCPRRTVPR